MLNYRIALLSLQNLVRAGLRHASLKLCSAREVNSSFLSFQSNTMSAVTSQPLPFDRLQREKHIQMIFRAFKNRCGPACKCRIHSPDWGSDEQPSPASVRGTGNMRSPVNRQEVEEQQSGAAAGRHFISLLETVEKIHITARTELQGESGSFHRGEAGCADICLF